MITTGIITIDTATIEPLDKNLFRAGAVDIGFTGNYEPRDVTASPYIDMIDDLSFFGLDFSGESTADYSHFLDEPGDGYNCDPRCQDQDGGKIFGKDFFHEWMELCDLVDCTSGYVANVQTGSFDEVITACDKGCSAIRWGGEQQLGENEAHWPEAGRSYKDKVQPWIDQIRQSYPHVLHIIDTAPSWLKPTRKNREWNDDLKDMTGDLGRFYIWADDFTDCMTIESVNEFWNSAIDAYENDFIGLFPDLKIAVTQFGWKQSSPNCNTGLNALYLAKGYRHFLNNQSLYGYCSFQSLKSLDNNQNNRDVLVLISELFRAQNVIKTTEAIPGIETVTTLSDDTYITMIINDTTEDKSISVKVSGRKVDVAGTGISFPDLYSTTPESYSVEGKTIIVKRNSILIVNY